MLNESFNINNKLLNRRIINAERRGNNCSEYEKLSQREYKKEFDAELDCILADIYRASVYNETDEFFGYEKEKGFSDGFSFDFLNILKVKLESLGYTVTLKTSDYRNDMWDLRVEW